MFACVDAVLRSDSVEADKSSEEVRTDAAVSIQKGTSIDDGNDDNFDGSDDENAKVTEEEQ